MTLDDLEALARAATPRCAFRFKVGSRCLQAEPHAIHHGKWRKHYPEPNHKFEEGPGEDILCSPERILALVAVTRAAKVAEDRSADFSVPLGRPDVEEALRDALAALDALG